MEWEEGRLKNGCLQGQEGKIDEVPNVFYHIETRIQKGLIYPCEAGDLDIMIVICKPRQIKNNRNIGITNSRKN